jgi:hypothetical protein
MNSTPLASKSLRMFIFCCPSVRHFHAVRRLCIRSITAFALIVALTSPALAMDLRELVGVWRCEGPRFLSEFVIQPDGRYSKLNTIDSQQQWISGHIVLMQNPPTMRLNIQDYAPKEWCGPLGCTPIRMIAAETYQFKLNQHELLLADPQNGGTWLYRRMQ